MLQGSVSGSLSGNSSTLFESGLSTIGEQGWWRLRSLDLPAIQLSRMPPKVLTRCGKDGKEKLCFGYATHFQQAFKTIGGSTGSCEQKRREGKLQVESSNKRLLSVCLAVPWPWQLRGRRPGMAWWPSLGRIKGRR